MAVGHVAMASASLEMMLVQWLGAMVGGQVDVTMSMFSGANVSDVLRRIEVLAKLRRDDEGYNELRTALRDTDALFTRRNEVIHASWMTTLDSDVVVRGKYARWDGAAHGIETTVTAVEQLADEFFNMWLELVPHSEWIKGFNQRVADDPPAWDFSNRT
jgi:hypothetical protein